MQLLHIFDRKIRNKTAAAVNGNPPPSGRFGVSEVDAQTTAAKVVIVTVC